MCDYLQMSAKAYHDLLNYRYHLLLGHRGKLTEINISFPEHAYHHLAGLHYLGVNAFNNRKHALNMVLSGKITSEHIAGWKLDNVRDRMYAVAHLAETIEACRIVYLYKGHEPQWSDIKADYAFVGSGENGASLLFVIGSDGVSLEPVTNFEDDPERYLKYCPERKIMKIDIEDTSVGARRNLFTSPSYRSI